MSRKSMWYTEEEEECNCNQGIINFRSIRFMINGSRIELRCRNCNRMVGWWHIFTEKIMPLRQTWSKEERKATR
jgi:hypothetical protein